MDRIEVEAVEDRSRAEGGHAIVLLRGVAAAPDKVTFRLRLVEVDGLVPDADPMLDADLAPVHVSASAEGLALTLGPEVTRCPALIPGTAVEIILSEIGVRGEFLWPAVTLAPLKRRNIMTRRVHGDPLPRRVSLDAPTATAPEAGRAAVAEEPASSRMDPSPSSPTPAAEMNRSWLAQSQARRWPITVTSAVPRRVRADAPLSGPAPLAQRAEIETAVAEPGASQPAASAPPAGGGQGASQGRLARSDAGPTRPRDEDPPAQEAVSAFVEPPGPQPGSSGGQAPRNVSALAPPPATPRISPGIAAALAVAVLVAGQIVAMRALDLSLARRTPAVVEVPTPRAVVAREERPALARGIYDVIAAGPRSPRGVEAEGVSPAKALQIAHGLLHGPEATRDSEEAIYWLKRYVLIISNTEHARIALTQLGSAYAQPGRGQGDLASARVAWELAGAMGDPVAMCFLGAIHEHGLGVPVARGVAAVWYDRAATAGRSCATGTPAPTQPTR